MLTEIPKFAGIRPTRRSTKALRRLHKNVLRKLEIQRIQCEQIAKRLEEEQAYLAALRKKRLNSRLHRLRRLRKRKAFLIKKRQLKTKEDEEILEQQRRAREVKRKRVKKFKGNRPKGRLRRKVRRLQDKNELEENTDEEIISRTESRKSLRRVKHMRALRRRHRLRQVEKEHQRALKLHGKRRQQQRERQKRWKLQKVKNKENRKRIQKFMKRKQTRLRRKRAKSRIKRKELRKKERTKKLSRNGRKKIRKSKGRNVTKVSKKRRVKRKQKGPKIKGIKRKTKGEADVNETHGISNKKGKKLTKRRRQGHKKVRRRRLTKAKPNKNEIENDDEYTKTKSKPKSRLKKVRRKSKKSEKIKMTKKDRTRRSTEEAGRDKTEVVQDISRLRKKMVQIKPNHKPKSILIKPKEVLQSKLRKKEIGKKANGMKEMEKETKAKAKSKLRHTLKWEEMRKRAKEAAKNRQELRDRMAAQPKQTIVKQHQAPKSQPKTIPEKVVEDERKPLTQQPVARLDVEVKPKEEEKEEKEDGLSKSLKRIKEAEELLSALETRKKRNKSPIASVLKRRRESIKPKEPSNDQKRIPGIAMSRAEILRKTRDSMFEHDLMVKREQEGEKEYKLDEFMTFKPDKKKMPQVRESSRNAALQEILKITDESPQKFKSLAMKREEALRETEDGSKEKEEGEQSMEDIKEIKETKETTQKAKMSELKRDLLAKELDWKLDSEWEMIVKSEQEKNQNRPSLSETSSIRRKTNEIKMKRKELQKKGEESNLRRKELFERLKRSDREAESRKGQTKENISKVKLKIPPKERSPKERGQKNANAGITPKPQLKSSHSTSSKQSRVLKRQKNRVVEPIPPNKIFPSTFLKGVIKFKSTATTPANTVKLKTPKKTEETNRSSGFQRPEGFRRQSPRPKKKDFYGYFRQSIIEQTPLTKFRSVGIKLRILRRMYRKLKKEKIDESEPQWGRVSDPVRLARLTGFSVIDEEKFPPYSVQMDAIPSNFVRNDSVAPERRLSLDRWKTSDIADNVYTFQATDDGMDTFDQ